MMKKILLTLGILSILLFSGCCGIYEYATTCTDNELCGEIKGTEYCCKRDNVDCVRRLNMVMAESLRIEPIYTTLKVSVTSGGKELPDAGQQSGQSTFDNLPEYVREGKIKQGKGGTNFVYCSEIISTCMDLPQVKEDCEKNCPGITKIYTR